ncbi:uncharacterized protein BHQ10_003469 [Talaromyces amestolkiae]|uniref:Uncharacterized protein n=1 Tax=Talaromyces amestolkiae TaxID=1196081 RepID=A0A364KV88_TALAM|nr:uncharacterized protein BHQ10_003469 [Talaromyces amestolkiae]RAO67457.1 hypothetical protein BHQ10_003469 [Talaromyces amestolkiae]
MIGNPGGLSLFQMMEDMKRDLDEQKKINEALKTDKFRDRVIELLNHTQVHHFQKDRQDRNARIHGANIQLDLDVVDWLQKYDEPEVAAAKQGFQAMYGLPFEEACSLISKAPTEITESINKKSNLSLLNYYSSHRSQEIWEMEQICTEILDVWRDSIRHGAGYPKDAIQVKRSEYERLHKMWEEAKRRTGRNKKRKLDVEDTPDLDASSGEV